MSAEPIDEKAVFNLARRIDGREARADYLQQVCGTHPEALRRVQELLEVHEQEQSFLESPAIAVHATIDQPLAEKPGMQVGPYKLLQQIGEGGMGVVYMAEQQEPVKRRVALKVIKPGMDTRQVIARFEAERQALSLMDHPNIAKVLDAGATDSGRPFFVMELVKGQPITQYCDEHHLTPRQRLELLLPVCQAIQHAHQKGIIHRDIKPTNILVAEYDQQPVPKVIDFGVAKATSQTLTEKTMFTGYGQIVGTLEYMSPEQAKVNQLDIDTRSDIYSLGVLMYELLTGSTPFAKQRLCSAAWDEMLRIIREEEPPKPSTRLMDSKDSLPSICAHRQTEPAKLSKLVRGELDWIVMKSLEKDRTRRYESVAGLSKDVQCWLNDEPVAAAPPAMGYRLRKFVSRHRYQTLSASLVVAALLLGITGTTWGLIEARQQAELAQAEVQEKERAQKTAEAERQKAVEFRDKALDALRATTGADVEQLLGEKKTLGESERMYLQAIARRWQSLAELEGTDEQSRAVRGEGRYRLGYLWLKLGRPDEAKTEYEQAIAIREALVAEFPAATKYQVDLATCHINLGSVLAGLGQRDAADQHYRRGLAIYLSLVDTVPAEAEHRSNLASSHNNLGVLLSEWGRHEEAEQHYRQGTAILTKLVEDLPDSLGYLRELARCQNNHGLLLADLGRTSEAEECYGLALENYNRLIHRSPATHLYRNELAWSHHNLGILLANAGNTEPAAGHYVDAITILEKLAVELPLVPEYRSDLASSLNNLAAVLADLGKSAEAQARYEQALAIQRELVVGFPTTPEFRHELARTHNNLGTLLTEIANLAKAAEQYRLAVEIQTKLTDEFSARPVYRQELARSCNSLGVLCFKDRNLPEAEQWYRQALTMQERLVDDAPDLPANHVELAGTCCNLGNLLSAGGRAPDSLQWYEKALNHLTTVVRANPHDVTATRFVRNAHVGRARAYQLMMQSADALQDWNRVMELTPPPAPASYRAARAIVLMQVGQISESVAEVTDLSRGGEWTAEDWYNFACVFSVASQATVEKRQEYAARATELLLNAVKSGWRDAAQLKQDPDLAPLRDHPDFQQLVDSLEAPGSTSASREPKPSPPD